MTNTQYTLRNFNETKIMIVLYKKKFDSLDNNLIIYQFYYNFIYKFSVLSESVEIVAIKIICIKIGGALQFGFHMRRSLSTSLSFSSNFI